MLFILHQVNCQNAFGAGFAGYISKHAPHTKQDYHNWCKAHAKRGIKGAALLGMFCCSTFDKDVQIVHLFSQNFYGNSRKTGKCYTDYEAMEFGISNLRMNYPDSTIICPQYMGCGLAGGDWKIVSQILKKYNVIPCDKIDLKNRVYHKARG